MYYKQVIQDEFLDLFLAGDPKAYGVLRSYVYRFSGKEEIAQRRQEDTRVSLHMFSWGTTIHREHCIGTYHPLWWEWDIENWDKLSFQEQEDQIKKYVQICQEKGLPYPTWIIKSGRGFHFVWQTRESYQAWEMGLLSDFHTDLLDDLSADHKDFINSAFVRVPQTYHSKSGIWIEGWFSKIYDRGNLDPILENGKKEKIKEREREREDWIIRDDFLVVKKSGVGSAVLSNCAFLRELVRDFSTHRYEGWRFVSYYYALQDDFETFIERSKKEWQGRVEQTPEYRIQRSAKELSSGVSFYTCYTISSNTDKFWRRDENPCANCRFRNAKKSIFKIVEEFLDDDILLPPGYWYDEGGRIRHEKGVVTLIPFRPQRIELLEGEKSYIRLIYETISQDEKVSKVLEYRDDFSEVAIAPQVNTFKRFMEKFLSFNVDKVRVIKSWSGVMFPHKVNFLGRDYFVSLGEHECEVGGNSKDFWAGVKKLVQMDEVSTNLALAVSLLGVLVSSSWYKKGVALAPAVIFVGKRGIGKTLRLFLANALWRKYTDVNLFVNTTPAYMLNNLGKVKGFIAVDELIIKGQEQEELLYSLVSLQGKKTTKGVYPAIESSYLFTAERSNILPLWAGLDRRFIIFQFDEEISGANSELIKILDIFKENFGWVVDFVLYLKDQVSQAQVNVNINSVDNIFYHTHHKLICSWLVWIWGHFLRFLGEYREYKVDSFYEGLKEIYLQRYSEGGGDAEIQDVVLVLKKALQDSAYIMKQAGVSQVPLSSLKLKDYEKEARVVLADKYYARDGGGLKFAFITSENIFLKAFKGEIVSRKEFERARMELFKKMSFFRKVKTEKILTIFEIFSRMLNIIDDSKMWVGIEGEVEVEGGDMTAEDNLI